jgi:hypothetical protein
MCVPVHYVEVVEDLTDVSEAEMALLIEELQAGGVLTTGAYTRPPFSST